MKIISGALVLLTGGLLLTGCAQTDVQADKAAKAAAMERVPGVRTASMLANTCAGCHGTNGASAGDAMPTIAGMEVRHLYNILTQFKTGERNSTIMGRIARGYSDLELKAIASFFAQKDWQNATAKTERKLVRLGKRVHNNAKCETCHEEGGRDFDDETPRLAGQWPDYTYNMLKLYQSSHPPAPRTGEMPKMQKRVKPLSDNELRALAHYYAAQK